MNCNFLQSLQVFLKYFVYKQEPITGSKVRVGTAVNIYLTKDPNKLEVPEEVFVDSTAIEEVPEMF